MLETLFLLYIWYSPFSTAIGSFDADPAPSVPFDADPDPDPSFQKRLKNLEKVLK